MKLLRAAIAAATFATAAHADPDRLGLSLDPLMTVEAATGPAARAGIQPGDGVLAVDGTPLGGVQTLSPFENVTGTVALPGHPGHKTFYVPVVLEDGPLEQ